MNFLLTSALILSTFFLQAQERYSVDRGEILIDGYDPVSYFDGSPIKGQSLISKEIDGRKLLFSSEENRGRFDANPDRFFPGYGGWCAIAMVDDTFVIPNYQYYKIQDDRLLFFRVQAFFNGLNYWEKKPEINKVKADANYNKRFAQ